MTCGQCEKAREAGYPRPTCHECGYPELDTGGLIIWGIYTNYKRSIYNYDMNGQWQIDLVSLKIACDLSGVENVPYVNNMMEMIEDTLTQKEAQDG